MIGRRKKTFYALYDLIRAIEADRDDLASVRQINLLLLNEIMRAEDKILRHKAALKQLKVELKTARGPRAETVATRRKMKLTEGYIDGYYRQLYIWKCFGDGLAFAYLDKYAVKHAFYGTETYDIKATAGMIRGKAGLENEVGCLLSALEHDVPAVLCDLTNILRYGDVCLLGGSDPCLIEVKSSRKLNQRGKRQAETLKKLTDFLETDIAQDFRVSGITKRVVVAIPERNHQHAMNDCIARAERDGACVVHPEPGLTYVATYVEHLPPRAFKSPDRAGRQIMFMLNEDKRAGTWTIYEPFTRSIREGRHLLDFIVGRLVIMVMFDVDALCAAMARPGWEVSFHEEAPAAIQFHNEETGARIGVSRQFLSRIGFEFVSLAWMAETQGPKIEEMEASFLTEHDRVISPGESDAIRFQMFGPDA